MKNLTMEHLAQVCGGELFGPPAGRDVEIDSITTDSRKAQPGCLFAAIPGSRTDGHSFIPAVVQAGALGILCEHLPESVDPEQPDSHYLVVPSTLEALKAIAKYYLAGLNIPVVGITGSVGKTSTKEMIAAILSRKYNTLKTLGNFNNELGLPLTIFRLRPEHEIAVLEMGISDFGEMTRLADIARPQTCVITNIGPCHLEFLGDRDGVLRAKTEIFKFLPDDGCAILNGDDDKLETVRSIYPGGAWSSETADGQAGGMKPVLFGLDKENDIYADHIEKLGLDGVSCLIHTAEGEFYTRIPIPGLHMVYNALAGTAVGLRYGLSLDQIRAGIESLQSVKGRFHMITAPRCTVIDDCYNANPASMKASLSVLQDAAGRKVAILGDMAELGPTEHELHREVGTYAAGLDLDEVCLVGPLCADLAEGMQEAGSSAHVRCFASLQELLQELDSLIRNGDTVLVKASHCMHFEKVVETLEMLSR